MQEAACSKASEKETATKIFRTAYKVAKRSWIQ
jgi:hypothetical protein